MQLMRSRKRSRPGERKACKGFLLTKKYLATVSSVWDLREKPGFQLTKTVFIIKISAAEPQILEVDPGVGVTALRSQNCSLVPGQFFLNLLPLPCIQLRGDVCWWIHPTWNAAQTLWWLARTKDGKRTENLPSNPVRKAGLMVPGNLIIILVWKPEYLAVRSDCQEAEIWQNLDFHGFFSSQKLLEWGGATPPHV